MKNVFLIGSIAILLTACLKEEELSPNATVGPPNGQSSGNTNGNTSSVPSSLYYFQSNNLRSFDIDNQGGGTFTKVSNDELTNEIYGISYDPSDSTFFGFTGYWSFTYTGEYFESYNPYTQERKKIKLGEEIDYHSVSTNTKLNKKILIKYDSASYERISFQEVSADGVVTFESPVVDLGGQVSNFIYVSSLDAFVAINDRLGDLKIAVIDANTYILSTLTLPAGSPASPIGDDFNHSNLTYDKRNDIIYYLRSDSLYSLDLNTQTANAIQTDWIEFFQGLYSSDELDNPETIYFPPTNELIIQGGGFFGSSTGSNKFFAIDLTTKKAREITTNRHNLSRVYGFAIAD